MRRGSIVRIVLVGLLVGALVTLVAVLIDWLPDPASEEMERIAFIFWFATVICIAIFALVAGWIALLRRPLPRRAGRRQRRPADPRPHRARDRLDGDPRAARDRDRDRQRHRAGAERRRRATTRCAINVTAQQFAWSFTYPDQDDLRSTRLVLPLDRPVELTLRANDVIHSFWIPDMGQKQDAVPGISTRLVITPDRLGDYPLVCTELCGLGHSGMRAPVRVVRPAAFAAWVREQQQGGGGGGEDGAVALHVAGLRRLPRVPARRHRRRGRARRSTTCRPTRSGPACRSRSTSATRS